MYKVVLLQIFLLSIFLGQQYYNILDKRVMINKVNHLVNYNQVLLLWDFSWMVIMLRCLLSLVY